MRIFLRGLRWALPAAVVLIVALGGCAASPPVQEMSDARQAIAAAREAGAAEFASDRLRAAEVQLADAERHLQQRVYWEARASARGAKDAAVDALLKSRSRREAGAAGAGAPPTEDATRLSPVRP